MEKSVSDENNKKEKEEEKKYPEPQEQVMQTQHSVTIKGEEIKYTVTAGTIILRQESKREEKAEKEKAKASIFFIAYTKDDVANAGQRPLTFSFNGGPGSSSVWLHMGLLGPRRIHTDDTGNLSQPPFRLIDNEYSLLAQTDLVFIDPVTTGYSRVAPGEKAKEFHNFQKDIESVAEFIRIYTSRNLRWLSPKFLIGESYGTTRAAGLAGELQKKHGMYLNGIMFISTILYFQTARFTPGNDLPYILFLPTYTATAWYHGRLAADLQQDLRNTLAEVEAFALNQYTLALMQGDALPPEARQMIVQTLARYTGLTETYIERTNLRINIHRFTKELRRDEGMTVGRLDSRFTARDRDSAGEHFEFDPSYAVIQGPYTATFNDYVRRELQYESDLPYNILTGEVWPWGYETHQNEFVNVAETLRQALNFNPHLKIFVANGYYDLATPYFATEYTFNHLGIDQSLHDNITMSYYEAGHMMYVHIPSLTQLMEDLAAYIQTAVPPQQINE
jgi:carboxypeptidase C (cathepsin A)